MMFAGHTLVLLALVSTWISVHAQEPATDGQSGGGDDETKREGEFKSGHEEIFKKLFIAKRRQHLSAVKNLRNLDSYERKYEMISIIMKNVIEIVEAKKNSLEGIKEGLKENRTLSYVPHELRDALSSVLENTAFLGDIALQLPDITHRILKKNTNWKNHMHWSLNFVNETRFLIDEATGDMLDLALQELNITQRLPSYSNPYASANQRDSGDKNLKRKRKEKKKRKSGPQMVHIDL
ncbi:coiled-coil domain-containing protein 134 [Diachasma alloeum]|uniref:coiled-coil domain-containing protein 134 n=1 Tax=Diachasma alloeum TaxID=454923 RepID=UPI0007385116|nr:coiled-coil domain-containing protein 134 [Diachasma alloeum]